MPNTALSLPLDYTEHRRCKGVIKENGFFPPSPCLCHTQAAQPVFIQCVAVCKALCGGQPEDTQKRKPSLQEAVFVDSLVCLPLLLSLFPL